jgi:hypothetical protein
MYVQSFTLCMRKMKLWDKADQVLCGNIYSSCIVKYRFALVAMGNSLQKSRVGTKNYLYEDVGMGGRPSLATQYTNPALRERIKARILSGSKGGKPGQWSARKAQLVALEYKKAGGGYKGPANKTQKSLQEWTRQKWTTSDGKPAIRGSVTTRYLPAKAWSKLSPAERAATNRAKVLGSMSGRQFVPNTPAAKLAGRNARMTPPKKKQHK